MSRTQAYHTLNVESEVDLNRHSNMMAPGKTKKGKISELEHAEATFKLIYDGKRQVLNKLGTKICNELKIKLPELLPGNKASFTQMTNDQELADLRFKYYI